MKGIEGNVYVVTGGASGIGAKIAAALAQLGAKVAITDVNAEGARAVADQLSAETKATVRAYGLDVTDSAEVDRIAAQIEKELGPVKGLAANAGYVEMHSAFDFPDEAWRKIVAVNLDGVFYCCRAFGRQMRGRGGSIVITSSIAATKVVRPERTAAYGAAKAAAAHLAALLGVEWASEGIRVNSVAPGYTATPMVRQTQRTNPQIADIWLNDQPIGRFIEPSEIADAFVYLLSDLSTGITGARLDVDGGYTKG
ncbi:SDR family NAD(P)-dependent oxidoreductase [Rhizobium sp. 2YAF20]|uniref:SDR family NAD(P)-dependent oxidoreductase n=1 Tax=Rhizobium sp. 2YAF20 TaxID=3233027 RepID=UPI003F97A432